MFGIGSVFFDAFVRYCVIWLSMGTGISVAAVAVVVVCTAVHKSLGYQNRRILYDRICREMLSDIKYSIAF